MSTCMSLACIDDELNNQLQCRYDCSDELITDKCSQFNATTHPSIDGYSCCPGYFLINVTESTYICQRCRDNTFMPDINKCCGCIICMECDRSSNDSIVQICTKTKNKQCKIEQDPTTPANVVCPFMMTSTGNPPTTKEVNTVHVTSTSDVPVLVQTSERKPYRASFYVMLAFFLVLLIPVLFVCSFVCFAYKTGSYNGDPGAASGDDGKKGKNDGDPGPGAVSVIEGRSNGDTGAASADEGKKEKNDGDPGPGAASVTEQRNNGDPGAASANEGRNYDNMSWKEIARLIASKLFYYP
ncbi:uncharacterized protein LOC129276182 [Lytechinus pictus]|uniref:uncharacterized protein LOC129276182 n=1 Tax=Lytechinus pictus TaxID=7653 RepID=UPI0030B9E933